ELVAVVTRRARLREPRAQLVRAVVGRGRRLPAALESAVGCEPAEGSGNPGSEPAHRDRCYIGRRFLPRHRAVQSRAAQAVGADSDRGKPDAKEVSGLLTTYEILLMLDPEVAESHQDEVIARMRDLVEKSGGKWRSHDAWGRRRLAYEIDKKPE